MVLYLCCFHSRVYFFHNSVVTQPLSQAFSKIIVSKVFAAFNKLLKKSVISFLGHVFSKEYTLIISSTLQNHSSTNFDAKSHIHNSVDIFDVVLYSHGSDTCIENTISYNITILNNYIKKSILKDIL